MNIVFVSSNHLIENIAVSEKYKYLLVVTKHTCYVYDYDGVQLNQFSVGKGFYYALVDDGNDAFILLDVSEINKTIVRYFSWNGTVINSFIVDLWLCDPVVDKKHGRLIADNYLFDDSSVYLSISNVSGPIAEINTTFRFPCSGVAVDTQGNIIVAGYGLYLYSGSGEFVGRLLPHSLSNSPQTYQKRIAYFDLYSNGTDIPAIRFIDYDGNNIMNVTYSSTPTFSSQHAYFYITNSGILIASIDNELKIWTPN